MFQSSGFWLTFVWIELLRLSVFLFISWANVSSFIQIGIIFDYRFCFKLHFIQRTLFISKLFRFVTEKDDFTIIKFSKLAVMLMTSTLLYEYLGVIFKIFVYDQQHVLVCIWLCSYHDQGCLCWTLWRSWCFEGADWWETKQNLSYLSSDLLQFSDLALALQEAEASQIQISSFIFRIHEKQFRKLTLIIAKIDLYKYVHTYIQKD